MRLVVDQPLSYMQMYIKHQNALKKTGGVLSLRNKVYLKKRRKEFTGDIMTLPQITKVKVGDNSPES